MILSVFLCKCLATTEDRWYPWSRLGLGVGSLPPDSDSAALQSSSNTMLPCASIVSDMLRFTLKAFRSSVLPTSDHPNAGRLGAKWLAGVSSKAPCSLFTVNVRSFLVNLTCVSQMHSSLQLDQLNLVKTLDNPRTHFFYVFVFFQGFVSPCKGFHDFERGVFGLLLDWTCRDAVSDALCAALLLAWALRLVQTEPQLPLWTRKIHASHAFLNHVQQTVSGNTPSHYSPDTITWTFLGALWGGKPCLANRV